MRQDVTIHAETAQGFFNRRNLGSIFHIFDPDRPHMDPNELLAEMGGVLDPTQMNFNCPFCHKDMRLDLFDAHMTDDPRTGYRGCVRRWWSTVDVTNRTFAGARPLEGA